MTHRDRAGDPSGQWAGRREAAGDAAHRQGFPTPAGGFFWTLGYDTIYAHQDKEDDVRLGVKSSALRLGEKTRPYLFAFYGLAIAWLALAGHLAALAWPYYAGLALGLAQLFWQAGKVDLDSSGDCLVKFGSNRIFGWIVLAGLIAAQLAN